MSALPALLACLAQLQASASPGTSAERQARLLEELGPGHELVDTRHFWFLVPEGAREYVAQVVTPMEATYDRFFLDVGRLGWPVTRPAEPLVVTLFLGAAERDAHLERIGAKPEGGCDRALGRAFLCQAADGGLARRELLAANVSVATHAAARLLWTHCGLRADPPWWLLDGLASALERDFSYESASLFHDGRRGLAATLVAARARGGLVPLAELVALAAEPAGERAALLRSEAWALVRHLIDTRPADLGAFLAHGAGPGDPVDEFRARLGAPEALEREYLARFGRSD